MLRRRSCFFGIFVGGCRAVALLSCPCPYGVLISLKRVPRWDRTPLPAYSCSVVLHAIWAVVKLLIARGGLFL